MELTPAQRTALERVRRFERLGGVDLSRLEPEDRSVLLGAVRGGVANLRKATFRFECPVCRKIFEQDQEMEPMCTGPSWTDDHEPTIMVRYPA